MFWVHASDWSVVAGWAGKVGSGQLRKDRRFFSFLRSTCPLFSLLLRCTLFFWHSWFCEALPASGFLLLTEVSYSQVLRLIQSFFLVFFDVFSSHFFKTNVIFIHFLFYTHMFHVSSSYCFLRLARCGFRLLPSFRWDALWGIFSDVTLPYLGHMKTRTVTLRIMRQILSYTILSYTTYRTQIVRSSTCTTRGIWSIKHGLVHHSFATGPAARWSLNQHLR